MKAVIIGSGNVATNLARALTVAGVEIIQVYSHTLGNAAALAGTIGAEATDKLGNIVGEADFYIISVKDDAIANVVESIPDNGALWMHTSGSTPIDVFHGRRKHFGVFYPMQSLSKQIETDFTDVPFFIEANFANHLWTIAGDVLQEAGLPFDVMLPLIRTTVDKLDRLTPAESQTGPAMRHDSKIMQSHIDMLDDDKKLIYTILSDDIMKRHEQD